MFNLKNDILVSATNVFYDFSRKTALKIFFFLLICIYAFNEGFQLRDLANEFGICKGIRIYVWSSETLLDTSIILISLFYLCTMFYNYFVITGINKRLIESSDFFSIDLALGLEENLKLQCNLLIFASFLKALNLLKFNPKTYLITDTLSCSLIDLAFLIMFVIVNYVIFGIIGHGLFYIDHDQFFDNKVAIHTSILSIVRHIDFDLLAKRKFFLLFAWQIFVWFYIQRTLISFVISIIIANFNEVRNNHCKTKTEKTFSRIVRNSLEYFNIQIN